MAVRLEYGDQSLRLERLPDEYCRRIATAASSEASDSVRLFMQPPYAAVSDQPLYIEPRRLVCEASRCDVDAWSDDLGAAADLQTLFNWLAPFECDELTHEGGDNGYSIKRRPYRVSEIVQQRLENSLCEFLPHDDHWAIWVCVLCDITAHLIRTGVDAPQLLEDARAILRQTASDGEIESPIPVWGLTFDRMTRAQFRVFVRPLVTCHRVFGNVSSREQLTPVCVPYLVESLNDVPQFLWKLNSYSELEPCERRLAMLLSMSDPFVHARRRPLGGAPAEYYPCTFAPAWYCALAGECSRTLRLLACNMIAGYLGTDHAPVRRPRAPHIDLLGLLDKCVRDREHALKMLQADYNPHRTTLSLHELFALLLGVHRTCMVDADLVATGATDAESIPENLRAQLLQLRKTPLTWYKMSSRLWHAWLGAWYRAKRYKLAVRLVHRTRVYSPLVDQQVAWGVEQHRLSDTVQRLASIGTASERNETRYPNALYALILLDAQLCLPSPAARTPLTPLHVQRIRTYTERLADHARATHDLAQIRIDGLPRGKHEIAVLVRPLHLPHGYYYDTVAQLLTEFEPCERHCQRLCDLTPYARKRTLGAHARSHAPMHVEVWSDLSVSAKTSFASYTTRRERSAPPSQSRVSRA